MSIARGGRQDAGGRDRDTVGKMVGPPQVESSARRVVRDVRVTRCGRRSRGTHPLLLRVLDEESDASALGDVTARQGPAIEGGGVTPSHRRRWGQVNVGTTSIDARSAMIGSTDDHGDADALLVGQLFPVRVLPQKSTRCPANTIMPWEPPGVRRITTVPQPRHARREGACCPEQVVLVIFSGGMGSGSDVGASSTTA